MQKMSQMFSQTLRAAPSDAETAGHAMLLRAGYIRPLASGIFSFLPLARRSMNKIEAIIHDEMHRIGGQEITMPVIHPAELWQETGRWFTIGSEMGRFKDKNSRDMVLAMTHEEVVADLVRSEIRSYRQLPRLVYQIQTKWRDDPRPRAGLIRVREFPMLDSYSLDADFDGLEQQYQAHYEAYFRIFERCGLPVMAVKSDTGMMGGKVAHEYMYLTPIGEDTIMHCSQCGYAANRQIAKVDYPNPPQEDLLPVEPVATPHASTIADLAEYLHIPVERTAKAVFFTARIEGKEDPVLVFTVVRGDMDVNETKLTNLIKAIDLRPALDEEIKGVGAVPGYASPVGLKKSDSLLVVADTLVLNSPNLVAGANREGFHMLNVNLGRDFKADITGDLVSVREGDPCPDCGSPLLASRAVEVGNIFQLGTRYTDALGCTYTDDQGNLKPVVMGSYGIGVGRLLGCLAEHYHDEKGLMLPCIIAPYQVYIVVIPGKSDQVLPAALKLAEEVEAAGLDVLVDERAETPGVKFNDADLIGSPYRITISERSLAQGCVELKSRTEVSPNLIQLDQVVSDIHRKNA
jgi:prolyl-tRNA synthetase